MKNRQQRRSSDLDFNNLKEFVNLVGKRRTSMHINSDILAEIAKEQEKREEQEDVDS